MIKKTILNKNLSRPNWVIQEHRNKNKLWLDKNECIDEKMNKIVLGALSKVSHDSVFSYPELDVLYSKIALFDNLHPENILITAGSDGAIRACFEISIQPGDKIILTKPTFAMYDVYSRIYGAKVKWLDYKKSTDGPILNLDSIIKAIKNTNPKMLCLPNPNSPTGTVFSFKEIKKIISIADANGTLIVIDEAYYPFYSISVSSLINKYKNLVVVRSFSKAWGAAGLRVGYALANRYLISLLHKQRPMYEIGNVSAKSLEILLNYEVEMKKSVKRLNEGKKYFQDSMRELGLSTYESFGNFFHVKFADHENKVHEVLKNKVYYRKNFNLPCLKGYSRFSSTTVKKFKPILQSIKKIVNENKK